MSEATIRSPRRARYPRRPPRTHAHLITYPGVDHFDIYDGPEHEAIVADQIAFLQQHLPPDSRCDRPTSSYEPLSAESHVRQHRNPSAVD
ncbi:hypothetical protein ACIO14_31335 [Nocardia fluminea]|uniref:hypothetical protein n=1 Tax=Nocardia fluminea TaxID=134984 RepID=UPI0038009146